MFIGDLKICHVSHSKAENNFGYLNNYQPVLFDLNETFINNGTGWVESIKWKLKVALTDENGKDGGTRIADVNGDGLVDYISAVHGYIT